MVWSHLWRAEKNSLKITSTQVFFWPPCRSFPTGQISKFSRGWPQAKYNSCVFCPSTCTYCILYRQVFIRVTMTYGKYRSVPQKSSWQKRGGRGINRFNLPTFPLMYETVHLRQNKCKCMTFFIAIRKPFYLWLAHLSIELWFPNRQEAKNLRPHN